MYIYKMVYADVDGIEQAEQIEELRNADVLYTTDYGIDEIQADVVQDLYEDEDKNIVVLDALETILDNEVVEALKEGAIDMVIVIGAM